jgi:hypothetical protein
LLGAVLGLVVIREDGGEAGLQLQQALAALQLPNYVRA